MVAYVFQVSINIIRKPGAVNNDGRIITDMLLQPADVRPEIILLFLFLTYGIQKVRNPL